MVYNLGMPKQQIFKGLEKPNPCFGGSLLNGNNPKTKRPLESKLPIHLVLRANQGGLKNPKASRYISEVFSKASKKYGVKIYEFVNVGNHIHIALKLTRIHRWAGFIREVTGKIALYMKRLNPEWSWKHRPYTRIVSGWKKPYQILKAYIHLNWLETMGFINRSETKTLKELRVLFSDG